MPVIINFKVCDNAEACDAINVCPTQAFRWNSEKRTLEIDKNKCIDCGKCATLEESCKVGAIRFAKTEEELQKIKKEIEEDKRTIKDLMVDRYGAQPINMPFYCKENELEKVISTKRTVLVEVFNEDSEECLIKSIPVKEIFNELNIPDLTYRKLEVKTDEFMNKYNVKELPSILIFKSEKFLGKIDGYYSNDEKEILIDKIKKIISNIS